MARISTLIENSKQAMRYWWLLLLAGILLLAMATFIFIYPRQSYLEMAVLFGWLMLLLGLGEVVLATSNKNFITGRGWLLVEGIIEVVLGVILIFNRTLSEEAMPIYLGFWLMFRGFSAVGLAGDMKALDIPGMAWTMFCGLMLLFFAICVLFQPLVIGTEAVVMWVGLSLLFAGITSCTFAWQFRRLHIALKD